MNKDFAEVVWCLVVSSFIKKMHKNKLITTSNIEVLLLLKKQEEYPRVDEINVFCAITYYKSKPLKQLATKW